MERTGKHPAADPGTAAASLLPKHAQSDNGTLEQGQDFPL